MTTQTQDFSRKIAIVVRGDLLDWQKLNVVAFLASSVAIDSPETRGQSFVTGSGNRYLPFINQPMLVYRAEALGDLRRAFQRANDRKLKVGIYTQPLFATKSETENLLEIAKLPDAELDLVGIVIYGEGKAVGKAVDGLRFHP